MEKLVEELKAFIVEENKKLKDDLRQEFKQDMNTLKQELKQDTNNLREELKQDINELRQEMINRFFIFETEFGRKIDIMYDYMMLQREIYQQKFETLRDLDKRMDIGEIRNLDYEKRISILERK